MGRLKKRGIAHFGVDYLKAILFWVDDKSPLHTLSDNSTFSNFDNETVVELMPNASDKWRKYYQIRDIKTNISLCFIWLWGKGDIRDFFEVTGQWLIARGGIGWFLNFSDKIGLKIAHFNRVDICLDLINVSVPYIYSRILSEKDRKKPTKIYYESERKGGWEQTIYFGEKSRKKNSYQLLRIYDKLADSRAKKKEYLYPWYEKYESVSRFEIEIRQDLAKFWTREKLIDTNYIFGIIVKNFYKFNYQFFWFLKFDDFLKSEKSENSLYRERKKKIEDRQEHFLKYGSSFKDDKERELWISTFKTYGRRLMWDGCTFDELRAMLEII